MRGQDPYGELPATRFIRNWRHSVALAFDIVAAAG